MGPRVIKNNKGTTREERAASMIAIKRDGVLMLTHRVGRTQIAKNKKWCLPAQEALTPGQFFDWSRTIIERVL